MNLLVTILSVTPVVGAVLQLLEERPAAKTIQQKLCRGTRKRRARRLDPRRATLVRSAAWRSRAPRHPLRALRAA